MTRLKFHVEWEDPKSARGSELAATWARLEILVDGEPISRLADESTSSVRDGVYTPAYPLAEWIAFNWWRLLNEPETSSRHRRPMYALTHDFRTAGEGFALPSLRLVPQGEWVSLEWMQYRHPLSNTTFLESGTALVDREEVIADLMAFLHLVRSRLLDRGISSTPFQVELEEIEGTEGEERLFCVAAGQLGLDPYSMTSAEQQAIVNASSVLSKQFLIDIFAGGTVSALGPATNLLTTFQKEASQQDLHLGQLSKLRGTIDVSGNNEAPWAAGYKLAQKLRTKLNLKDRVISSVPDLGQCFGAEQAKWNLLVHRKASNVAFVVAAFAESRDGAPAILLRPSTYEANETFSVCRALYGYLAEKQDSCGLVTTALTSRQKAGRAFAAEFMLPAQVLRSRIESGVVSKEEISDISDELRVSELIVRHQIENFRIAEIQ